MAPTELRATPARRATVTDAERDALLTELQDYPDRALPGAQAILDEVELGSRVAETFARTTAG